MSSTLPVVSPSLSATAARPQHGVIAPPGVESIQDSGQPAQNFSFSDFLSVINPLQHIPIVGTIYRAITGDTLAPAARVLGGTLFGGPIGLISSALNAVIEQTNGKDLGDQALAWTVPGNDKLAAASAPPAVQHAAAPAPSAALENDAEASPPAAPLTAETSPAPVSRALFAAQNAPAGDRTLSGSLVNRQGSTAPGRTLSDYRSFAGRPLPTIDASRSASTAAPVRLQTTGPITPERGRTPILAASGPTNVPTTNPAEAMPKSPTNAPTTAENAAGTPQTHWFQAAMMKGLDRYREGRRADTAPAQQLDTTL